MKFSTSRLILTLPVLVLPWLATPAGAQDGADADLRERRWQTVRRGEMVAGGGDSPWQNATDTAVSYTLTPDPQNPDADLLTVQPLAAAVGATGRGQAAVGFGPEAATVLRVDRLSGVVTRADGADAAGLDQANAADRADAAGLDQANAADRPEDGGARPDAPASGLTASPAPRSMSVPLTAVGNGLTGLGDAALETTTTPVTVNGRTVAHLQQYSAAPVSFTTPEGDMVVLRAGGYAAVDPSGAVVLASGQSAAGQVVTARGDLLPYATQQSSRAGAASGGSDPLGPAARAALNALLPADAPLTTAGYSAPDAAGTAGAPGALGAPNAGNSAPPAAPAWASAVTAVAAAIDAAAVGGALGDAPDPFAAARAAAGLTAAAVGNRINALANNPGPNATGVDASGLLAPQPGGALQPAADNAAPSPAANALAAALNSGPAAPTAPTAPAPAGSPATAQNPLAPGAGGTPLASAGGNSGANANTLPRSGSTGTPIAGAAPDTAGRAALTAPATAGLTALAAPRAPQSGSSGVDGVRAALGGRPGGGGNIAAALGGAAVYGINPVTGAAGPLPDLTPQVLVNSSGQDRTLIANLTAAMLPVPLTVAPPSSNGFTSVSVNQGLFTFSVFDSGGSDNEDVQNITLTNNGVNVAVMAADGMGDGSNTTLLFLTDGQGTTFDAVNNPAVASNQFTAALTPGQATLSLEGVSSVFGPNTGAFSITSPLQSGNSTQIFELRETPSNPPDPIEDFANLGILVNP